MKGAAINTSTQWPVGAKRDLELLVDPRFPSLRLAIERERATWADLSSGLSKCIKDVQSRDRCKHTVESVQRYTDMFESVQRSYQDMLWRRLSIDLVAACRRQRSFATKITANSCKYIECASELHRTAVRYGQFLGLMIIPDGAKGRHCLVPTLEIDLWWHTHQLFPRLYREWCLQHVHRPVNHDDTIGESDLKRSLAQTASLWQDSYQDTYGKITSHGKGTKGVKAFKKLLVPLKSYK